MLPQVSFDGGRIILLNWSDLWGCKEFKVVEQCGVGRTLVIDFKIQVGARVDAVGEYEGEKVEDAPEYAFVPVIDCGVGFITVSVDRAYGDSSLKGAEQFGVSPLPQDGREGGLLRDLHPLKDGFADLAPLLRQQPECLIK